MPVSPPPPESFLVIDHLVDREKHAADTDALYPVDLRWAAVESHSVVPVLALGCSDGSDAGVLDLLDSEDWEVDSFGDATLGCQFEFPPELDENVIVGRLEAFEAAQAAGDDVTLPQDADLSAINLHVRLVAVPAGVDDWEDAPVRRSELVIMFLAGLDQQLLMTLVECPYLLIHRPTTRRDADGEPEWVRVHLSSMALYELLVTAGLWDTSLIEGGVSDG